jgi:Tfp pilus assembly protein PilO
MKWKNLYNNYLIYFGFVVGFLLLLTAFVIIPAFNKITAIKREITQEKEQLEKKLSVGLNAKSIKTELEAIENSLPILDSVLLNKDQELGILTFLENSATANKLTVKSLKPDFNRQAISPGIDKINLTLDVTGNFNDILRFLSDLDGAGFYLTTDELNLYQDKTATGLSLNGWVYFKSI